MTESRDNDIALENNNNNSKNHKDMKLNISNNNETKNVANNAQVTNPATAPIVVAKDSKPVPAEEYVEFEEVKEEAPDSQLSTVKFSTYTTKKGATAPQIIGFSGEDDPRWKKHKDAQSKYVSACYRRDINGEKVYILMFGVRYMDVAKALAGAYNTDDQEAWKRAEDAVVAIYEQAQRDGKAQWEAKKAEWKAKSEEKKAKKEAEKKCYTKEDVAAMLNTLLKGGDVPEDIKKLIKAA